MSSLTTLEECQQEFARFLNALSLPGSSADLQPTLFALRREKGWRSSAKVSEDVLGLRVWSPIVPFLAFCSSSSVMYIQCIDIVLASCGPKAIRVFDRADHRQSSAASYSPCSAKIYPSSICDS